ncbi:putative aminopeptidase [Leptospira ryugenii]|uniref:Putative aminopeptidase n=1 Tax=Leptospira ryugenii TaxID=1917863 RepID=A0A2P2E0X5_9LEPT|nr:putative aminopeptidase [Leptospira ryugenii]
MQDTSVDERTKKKLALIQLAREYAVNKLKLNPDGGFEYYTKLDREEIGWNVSACQALAFESYTWWFPFAGTVPYKGFFSKDLALKEEESLKRLGLDTRVRAFGGYSTLGWFSDPVLSPQLDWEDTKLVGLVFHEMAHATSYLPGDSNLNESYASYVEEKGLERFYKEREGKDSPSLKEILNEKKEKETSIAILKKYAYELDKIYKSQSTDESKLQKKKETIQSFKEEVIRLNIVPAKKIETFRKKEWNNEDFLGVLRYHSGNQTFESLFTQANEDFGIFHSKVKELFSLSAEERKKLLNLP